MFASYNITTDKLHLQPSERLSEDQYAAAKAVGFTWWPGSKQFVSKWNARAEDFIKSLRIEIDADDTPDDVENRVGRFTKYAERSEAAADSAADYLAERANTERRRKNAANAIERGLSEAEHWQRRIAASIQHAQRKDRPDVVARRIKGLEADARKFARRVVPVETLTQRDVTTYNGVTSYWIDGSWIEADKVETMQQNAQRWAKHTAKRLQYERALLAASGGIAADNKPLEVGGAIRGGWQLDAGQWGIINKVNTATVEILISRNDYNPKTQQQERRTAAAKVEKTKIAAVMTAADVAAFDGFIYARGEVKQPKAKKTKPPTVEPQSWETSATFCSPQPETQPAAIEEVAARNHAQRMEQIKALQPVKVAAIEKREELQQQRDDAKVTKQHIETMAALPKIASFFPTPRAIVERMIEEAHIEPQHRVLEPSAGAGHIADAVLSSGATVDCIEINNKLLELLAAKIGGRPVQVLQMDFLEHLAPLPEASGMQYDRVLMNPPFEKLQDIDHVRHAFKFLKPGGRMVAIMGEGAFFRSDTKAQQFRDWLDEKGGVSEQLPEGSFKCSDRPTGVNCRLVIVDAPEPQPQQRMTQLTPQLALF